MSRNRKIDPLIRLRTVGAGMAAVLLCPSVSLFAEPRITTSDPVTYAVRMTTSLRIPGRIETDRLTVRHALPPKRPWSLFTGNVGATGIQFSAGGQQEFSSRHDSHYIEWVRNSRLDPGEEHRFLSQFEVRSVRRMLLPGVAGNDWKPLESLPPSVRLASEIRPEDIHPRIVQEAKPIRETLAPYDAVVAFTTWIGDHMTYDPTVRFSPGNVDSALGEQKGHEEHNANIFVQFCGAVGIPVRKVHGLALREENGEGEWHSYRRDSSNRHIWAEVYFPEVGWVEVKPVSAENPFSVGSHFIRNNGWFQNYSVQVVADGEEREPGWIQTRKEGIQSEYHIEHRIEFRATPE